MIGHILALVICAVVMVSLTMASMIIAYILFDSFKDIFEDHK